MDINFEEYLSESERKEIVASVFREKCVEALKQDGQRIISNSSYEIVQKMVDEIFDGKLNEILVEKTKEVINGLTSYTVFKNPNMWDAEASEGYKYLQEVIRNSKPLIQARITEIIATLNEDDMRQSLRDEAIYLLDSKLFGAK